MIIHITIPITPKAQKRDRIGVIAGKARSYKDKSQKLSEGMILHYLMPVKPPVPLIGAISLAVNVFVPIPKSKPRVWREKALAREIRPISRPDVDNYGKQILDCMNGIYFQDDRQVVDLHISKWYAEEPRWEIRFEGDY